MPAVPRHGQITPGTLVSIVLKADQRTGRQVQGTVAQLLTRGDHPRGVKVRLTDGRIGRVQKLAGTSQNTTGPSSVAQASTTNNFTSQRRPFVTMTSEQNPWADSQSTGNPYVNNPPSQQQHDQYQQYQAPPYPPRNYQQQQPHQQQQQQHQQVPQQGIQRSDTDRILAQQEDGSEQVEQFQHYEQQASAKETEDDRNQAALQKEFPNIDSSLIAALYGDNKNVSEVREMLQELNAGEGQTSSKPVSAKYVDEKHQVFVMDD